MRTPLSADILAPLNIHAGGSTVWPGRESSPAGTAHRHRQQDAEVCVASAGDHALLYQQLLAAGQSLSPAEFQASIDDPYYEPSDRLLIRLGERIVSHVQLSKREIHFGTAQLPAAELQALATLPEYRPAGFTRRLLAAADVQMRADGAVVALIETRQPEPLLPLGWFVFDRHRYTQAGARDILSHLSANQVSYARPLSTRMWRHVELPALMRIYRRNTQAAYGPFDRSEDYWRWLIGRKGYEQILVAIEGDDRLEFGEQAPQIVGYAVMRQEEIVELYTEPGHPAAAAHLLTRACRDAIERDYSTLRVHAAAEQKLAPLLLKAGGTAGHGLGAGRHISMMKILDLAELISRLCPEFHARSKAAGIPRPFELQVSLSDLGKMKLTVSRRSSRLVPSTGRHDISTSTGVFSQMLLGLVDAEEAADAGLLQCRTRAATQMLHHLLPALPLWQPPFDRLPA